jgi:hypothetical protein
MTVLGEQCNGIEAAFHASWFDAIRTIANTMRMSIDDPCRLRATTRLPMISHTGMPSPSINPATNRIEHTRRHTTGAVFCISQCAVLLYMHVRERRLFLK